MRVTTLLLAALGSFIRAATDCETLIDCVSCTSCTDRKCGWQSGSKCVEVNKRARDDDDGTIMWEDMCEVPKPPSDVFLENWMGHLMDLAAFKNAPLLDLMLPGTHDTLSYDLQLRVSDGGIDDHAHFAEVLHKYEVLVPNVMEDFIRTQAQTQRLPVSAQLDNGVRFLDLRMMYSYSDKKPDWYSLHMLESRKPMINYFIEIRDWLAAHPTEIVAMWLSRHGSPCATGEDQYPSTPMEAKTALWGQIEATFGDMMTGGVRLNETSVQTMISNNQRAVFYVADYNEMTGGSSDKALDACLIDNQLGPSVDEEEKAAVWEQNLFISATLNKWKLKSQQGFLLMSMATGVPAQQVLSSAALRFGPGKEADEVQEKCAEAFHIPQFDDWCPPTLLDISNLESYYKQLTLAQCLGKMEKGWSFPNAIYLNGLDYGGRIRTGTQVLWGAERSNSTEHSTTGFAYVDTLIAANVYQACNPVSHHNIGQECSQLTQTLKERIAQNPVTTWSEPQLGRLQHWPDIDRGGD